MIERKNFVSETARFWSERTGKRVSPDDAREMIQSVSRFFGILKRWKQQKNEKSSPIDGKIERKPEHERICRFEDNATMSKI